MWTRSPLTTLKRNSSLGLATITHPFHPLRGQQFQVLNITKRFGREILIIKHLHEGTKGVDRSWTDMANPDPYNLPDMPAPILSFQHLQQLVDRVQTISNKNKEEASDAKKI